MTFGAYASQTFTTESDNGQKVCYKATDTAGNIAYSMSDAIAGIDTTKPTITITNPSTSPAQSKTITAITSEGNLEMSNTRLSACDGSLTFGAYASQTFTTESDNGQKVCYKATDTAGNIAYNMSDAIAGIDTTKPTITITNPSTSPAQSKTITAITSEGNLEMSNTRLSACDASLTFGAYASQTFTTESDNGQKVCYKATDTAGNIAYNMSDAIAGIDTTKPTITITNPSTSPAQSKTITAITSEGNLEMSNTRLSACDASLTFGAYASQTFTTESDNGQKVCYKATDSAGNIAYNMSDAIAGIDTTKPTITITNPSTSPAQSKTITAITSEGSLEMSNTRLSACDASLTFGAYASQTFTTESDNGQKVCYKATDSAGNIAYNMSDAIAGIDTTKPTITITNPSTSPAQSKTITAITSEGNLEMSNTRLSACDASLTFGAYASQTFTTESDNGQKVCYKATDTAGNIAYNMSDAIAGIDTTKPTITITNPSTSPAQSKTITAITSEGSLEMSNTRLSACDGSLTFGAYASQTFTTESDNGQKVCYKATDTAGNIAYKMSNAIAGIDTTKPTITITNPSTSPAQSKTITAITSEGNLEMSNTRLSACDASLTFGAYASQTFTTESDNGQKVCYKATDTAGNIAYNMSNAIAGIDTTKPTITITNPSTSPAQSKTITAITSEGSLEMSNTKLSACDASLTFGAYASQTFTTESDNGQKVCYKATDTAGNIAYKMSNAIAGIDTTKPTITITNPSTSPAQSKTITAITSEGSLEMSNTRTLSL